VSSERRISIAIHTQALSTYSLLKKYDVFGLHFAVREAIDHAFETVTGISIL
jgi:hypothetical protein